MMDRMDALRRAKQRVKVRCECGEAHEVIPCEWLAFIREREWVPRPKGQGFLQFGNGLIAGQVFGFLGKILRLGAHGHA